MAWNKQCKQTRVYTWKYQLAYLPSLYGNLPKGGGDMLILDRGYSLAKLPRFFEGAEKFG